MAVQTLNLYVMSYDVRCNKRRNKLIRLLQRFGGRVHLSVFEVYLSAQQKQDCIKTAQKILDLTQDRLAVYPVRDGIVYCGENINDVDVPSFVLV